MLVRGRVRGHAPINHADRGGEWSGYQPHNHHHHGARATLHCARRAAHRTPRTAHRTPRTAHRAPHATRRSPLTATYDNNRHQGEDPDAVNADLEAGSGNRAARRNVKKAQRKADKKMGKM